VRHLRSALLASAFALGSIASPAWAVVPNDSLLGVNPDGSIDESRVIDATGVTGIGLIVFRSDEGLSGCTTTLINPRTAILAAHCVNQKPDSAWGRSAYAMVSFLQDAGPALDAWQATGQSQPELSTYNVVDITFDPRSLDLPDDPAGVMQADVALAALQLPAVSVPTWKLLFSPLPGPTEVVFTGYGRTGSGTLGNVADAGFVRRTATNTIDVLASPIDIAEAIYILSGQLIPQMSLQYTSDVYIYDFDDPAGVRLDDLGRPYANLGGGATAREGSVAQGDSGGPLIVPSLGDGRILAGVVSGGLFYPNDSVNARYGQFGFYQPLSQYWDWIVDNNFYRYVGAKAGDGDWFDATHWVERLDPSYQIASSSGVLTNALPGAPALGANGAGANFGQICLAGSGCLNMADASNPSTDTPRFPTTGPGASGFVPTNGFFGPGGAARFYDVTLSQAGTTTLSGEAEIDALTLAGPARLDITGSGALGLTIGARAQGGWLNVDGLLQTPTFTGAAGLLTGSGRVRAYSFDSALGIGPGGFGGLGRLTLQTDARLAPASVLQIDLARSGADQLAVIADPEAARPSVGGLILGGTLVLNPVAADRPRAGDQFRIITAQGGLLGDFGAVADLPGVMRGELTYGADAIDVTLAAGLYADLAEMGDGAQAPYARLLDAARGPADGPLAELYDGFDYLEGQALAAGLRSLAPLGLQNAEVLGRVQTETLADALAARTALGDRGAGAFVAYGQGRGDGLKPGFDARSQIDTEWLLGGAEARIGRATVGGALAYSRGDMTLAAPQAEAESKLWQALAFARLTGAQRPWMLEGSVGLGRQDLESRRSFTAGGLGYGATGDTEADLYTATLAGTWSLPLDQTLSLVPQASVRAARFEMDGFTERGGPAALAIEGVTADSVQGRVGVAVEGVLPLASARLTLQGRLALAHEFADAPDATLAFAANRGARTRADIGGRDRDWQEAGLTLAYEDGPLSLHLAAEADLNRAEAEAVDLRLGAAFRF
jgi:subtilase-type serine protease